MKTFGACSNCSREHYWREIDFDNMLYVNVDKALCLTMCPSCVNNFLQKNTKKNVTLFYKQNISNAINGKVKPILDFNLGNQNNDTVTWSLSF